MVPSNDHVDLNRFEHRYSLKKTLRIAINAQIIPGTGAGGIETVLRFLTSLGRLDGDEKYVFIRHWADETDWLVTLMNDGQEWIKAPRPQRSRRSNYSETLKSALGPLRPFAGSLKRWLSKPTLTPPNIPMSDGFYEGLNCDVIHFPYQEFVHTGMPAVFNPHDLQHLHYPQYFSSLEIQRREAIYPTACRAAHTVIAPSRFVKQDLVKGYGLDADKIQVIPWGPTDTMVNELAGPVTAQLREKYDCPAGPFALYPAVTWEHKNHIRLLEAIALLRDRDKLKVNFVCTGHKNSFFPEIEKRLKELRLDEQIRFTGVVEQRDLSGFYRDAQFVMIPTLFEAASAPVFEAWQHDAAVACSAVTSLPEQVGAAALLFDPLSVVGIADAMKRMICDPILRADLRLRGRERLQRFDPELTAKSYRAVYRRAAGLKLNDEDINCLIPGSSPDFLKEKV